MVSAIVDELDDHVEDGAGMHDFALNDSTSTANEQYLDQLWIDSESDVSVTVR